MGHVHFSSPFLPAAIAPHCVSCGGDTASCQRHWRMPDTYEPSRGQVGSLGTDLAAGHAQRRGCTVLVGHQRFRSARPGASQGRADVESGQVSCQSAELSTCQRLGRVSHMQSPGWGHPVPAPQAHRRLCLPHPWVLAEVGPLAVALRLKCLCMVLPKAANMSGHRSRSPLAAATAMRDLFQTSGAQRVLSMG